MFYDLRKQAEAMIAASPGGGTRFFDVANFAWTKKLEAAWPAMRAELDRLLTVLDRLPCYEKIERGAERQSDGRWKMFPLYIHGHDFGGSERRCPATCEALKNIPGLKVASFSILQAGKALTPHRGPYSGVLRYQLALKVPQAQTQCGIFVGGEQAHWREGKSMIFDDSHVHYAWNHSEEDRAVLFVDFVRPLSTELAEFNAKVISVLGQHEMVTDAVRNWRAWESKYGQSLDQAMADVARRA